MPGLTPQPLGTLVASGIAYAFIPRYSCAGGADEITAAQQEACTRAANSGWRYALYTIGAITLFVFFIRFLVFNFRESPAYLINKGHDEEALRVLYSIAKLNKAPQPQLTMEDFKLIENHCNERARTIRLSSESDSSVPGLDDIVKPTTTATPMRDSYASSSGGQTQTAAMEKDLSQETNWQSFKRILGESGEQLKGVKLLFRDRKMARITILLWLTYMAE